MASCLDFPAVTVALEHIKELDRQLKEDGGTFSAAASVHLMEISAAISELETEWRAARERLEVESLENSNLERQVGELRELMSQEVMAELVATRAVNAEEMEQLCKDLREVSEELESTAEKQAALASQKKELGPEREQVKAEFDEVLAALDAQIILKCAMQEKLEQTLGQTQELKRCIAAVEKEKIGLKHTILMERQELNVKQEKFSKEVKGVEGQIKKKKRAVRRSQRELDRTNEKKQEACEHLSELALRVGKLESSLQTLSASRRQGEAQLELERQKQLELRQQRETLKKERNQLRQAFKDSMQRLEEEISRVESEIEAVQTSGSRHHDSLAQVAEKLKSQQNTESRIREEHVQVSKQLEHWEQLLEEQISSLVKHQQEITEMDERVAELLEADALSKLTFERECEEVCKSVDAAVKNTRHCEEERSHLGKLLEEKKKEQVEHEERMNSEIGRSRRRYQELLQKEAEHLRQEPRSANAEMFLSYIRQHETELIQEEARRLDEIEQVNSQIESWARNNEEQARELQEEEKRLREAEATWKEEEARYEGVRAREEELREQRDHLEATVQCLQEETEARLRAREEAQAALEVMQKHLAASLGEQAGELRATEVAIYDSTVKLQQVEVENSRLHLQITQMSAKLRGARQDEERYRKEARCCRRSVEELAGKLQEAWREDVRVTKDSQKSSGEALRLLGETRSRLECRRERLDGVGALLRRHTVEFCRQPGVIAGHQSVSADL